MPVAELRFSSGRLFYFVTLCAASTSLFGWLGVPVACFVMLIWMQLIAGARREQSQSASQRASVERADPARRPRSRHRGRQAGLTKLELVAVLLIVTMVVGLMIPAGTDYDLQQQAGASMGLVAQAVDAYQQHFGVPPPTVVYGADGEPLHSWRALILPYLGEEKLAAAYRLDEAWNSPHNSRLLQYRPWHYRMYCPSAADATTATISADSTLGSRGVMDTAAVDARTTTMLHLVSVGEGGRPVVVEHEQALCDWLEPTQLEDCELLSELPDPQHGFWRHGFFSSWYRGRLAAAGRHGWRLHPGAAVEKGLERTLAMDRRSSQTPPAFTDVGQPWRVIHWDNALRLSVFLVVALYPLRWLTAPTDCLPQPPSAVRDC